MPPWVWLSIGLAIGLLVALAVYLSGARPPSEHAAKPAAAVEASPSDTADTDSPQEAQPPAPKRARFDFYNLLPEREVVVPERPSEADADAQTPPPPDIDLAAGDYILQAGSFRRRQDADKLKASLALLGVQARIQTVTVDDITWHRVRVGPSASAAQLKDLRARLRRHRIDTLLLKVRK